MACEGVDEQRKYASIAEGKKLLECSRALVNPKSADIAQEII